MCATYYARTSDHGYETCAEHLAMAGCLAGGFAKGFGYLDDGLLAGLVHDLGKYSDAFQRRIRNPDHCGPVDHSTAGALLLMRHACPLAAMAVAGHHAGLPDLGSYGELEGPTFMSRMNKGAQGGGLQSTRSGSSGRGATGYSAVGVPAWDSIREADDLEQAFRAMVAVHRHDVDAHAVLRFGGCGST